MKKKKKAPKMWGAVEKNRMKKKEEETERHSETKWPRPEIGWLKNGWSQLEKPPRWINY